MVRSEASNESIFDLRKESQDQHMPASLFTASIFSVKAKLFSSTVPEHVASPDSECVKKPSGHGSQLWASRYQVVESFWNAISEPYVCPHSVSSYRLLVSALKLDVYTGCWPAQQYLQFSIAVVPVTASVYLPAAHRLQRPPTVGFVSPKYEPDMHGVQSREADSSVDISGLQLLQPSCPALA